MRICREFRDERERIGEVEEIETKVRLTSFPVGDRLNGLASEEEKERLRETPS